MELNEIAEKINDFSSKIEGQKKRRDRLAGALEVAEKNLKELGFDSVAEAQKYIDKESKRLAELKAELEEDIEEFNNEYAEYLAG